MGTGYIDPDEDAAGNSWNLYTYANVDDGVRQPTDAENEGDGLACLADANDDDEFQTWSMTTWSIPGGHAITEIKIWIYGYVNGTADDPTADINITGCSPKSFSVSGPASWRSVAWTDADFGEVSQGDIDGITVTIQMGAIGGVPGIVVFFAVYIEITTVALGPEDVDEINAVPKENIDEINGVPIEDIAEINTVS